MQKKSESLPPVWVEITHLNEAQSYWIWWILEGTPNNPQRGSRSFSCRRDVQENLESRGYHPLTSAIIEDSIIQARIEGKDEALIKVCP